MEERFPASILVVAGLLRVAGASRSDPWSAHTTDQSSLEEGLVTATAHLVPIREDEATPVTLPFDSLTSDFSNDGVSHLHEIIRTEAEVNSEDRGQPLTFSASQPRRAELPFLERAILARQSKDSSTNRPHISKGLSGGSSKMAAESTNRPEVLTTFLPREDQTENATGHDPSVSGKQSSPAAEMDLLTPEQLEPLEGAGRKMTTDSHPSLATRPENPHTSTLDTNTTKSEVSLDETELTPAKERLGSPPTFLPSDSQQLVVNGGQTQPDLQTSEVPRAPGFLVELNVSAPPQQQLLSEDDAAMQGPDFASSPRGKTTRHKAIGLQAAETPAVPTPSQSHSHLPSLVLTPETLSSVISPQSAMPGDAGQRDQPGSIFRSLLPPSSSDPHVPDGAEEHVQESTPLTLRQETHRQMTIQTSTVKLSDITAALRDPLPVSRGQETTLELPALIQGQSQLPTMLPTGYGKAEGRVLSMSPLGITTSLHAHPTMPHVAASSHISLLLPDMLDTAGHVTEGTPKIPPPSPFPPLVHRRQVSLSTSAPPLPGAELLASSSASVPSKPPTAGITATVSAGPARLGTLASLPTAPRDESEELPVETAGSVPAKLPVPGTLAFVGPGPHVSAAADSAHSIPRLSGLSSTVYGELQGRASGIPSQAEHQTLGSSVSTLYGPTVPDTPVPSSVQTGVAAAGLNVLATAVDGRPRPKLPPGTLSPFYVVKQSLPIGAGVQLQSATPGVCGPGPQTAVSEAALQTRSKSEKPDVPASLMKKPQLPSTPAHAKQNTVEAQAEGRLTVSNEATASIPTHAEAPLALSIRAQTETPLPRLSSHSEARTIAYGAQTPNAPASSPGQPLGQFMPQPSSSSVFVQTELQPQALLTSAEAATPNPKVAATAHPNPPLPSTLVLPIMLHTTANEEGGESSPPSSPPTSQPTIYNTLLTSIAAAAPSPKAEGREQSSGTPSSPASPTVHHKNINLPMLSSVRIVEHFPSVRTTQILAGDETQDLPHSSQGFLLHLLNQSDVTVDTNVDSAAAGGYLGIPSSLQYFSFSIRSAENMICLQPMQNTTSSSGGPDLSGPGVASFQEMLIASPFLGLSHSGASSPVQTSPSSVLLVKPMLVFLPSNELEDPVLHSAEEEEEQVERYSFPKTAVLRLVASHYEQLVESNSTVRQSTGADGLSANREAVSGSVLNSVLEYATGPSPVRPTALKVEPFPELLREVATTRTNSLESKNQKGGFLSSVLDSPKPGENNVTPLSVEHRVSVPPPMTASVHQRPSMLPPTSELLSSSLRITALPSMMEQSVSPKLGRASRPEHTAQLKTTLMLHAKEDHHPGSMTPITSSSKNSEEPPNTSFAGNTDGPLEVVKNLTSSRAVMHHFLPTQVFQKHPSEVQHIPSTVSDFLMFSTVKDLKGSAAINYSYSEAVPALPRATETSSYVMNGTLAKVTQSQMFSLIPPRAHTKEDQHLGLRNPITFSSKNSEEPSNTSSAGNMDGPLEVVKNLTSLRAVMHRFLPTQVFQKHPSEVQHVPSTVSDLLTFSTVKDLNRSVAINYSYSEAVPALPRATEMSSYVKNGTLAKVTQSQMFSLIPLRAHAKEDHRPGSVTPIPSSSKNSEEPSNTSSAGNTDGPLEVVKNFTSLRAVMHRFLPTQVFQRHPSEVQHITVPDLLTFSTVKDLKASAAINYFYSETVPALPRATETSSFVTNGTLVKVTKSPLFSLTSSRAHAKEDHNPGSMTPITSSSKNSEEPSNTSSAGHMDGPLEMVKNFTSLRAGSHHFLPTQVFQKHPSEVQHVPSTVPDLLTFSTLKDLKGSAAIHYSYSEAVPALPRATETSSFVMNGTLAKVTQSQMFSLIPLRAHAKEDHRPGSMTPITSITKSSEEPSNTSSAGNMDGPLEVVKTLISSRGGMHRFLPTKVFQKHPSEVQHVPSTVPDLLTFSTLKDLKGSATIHYSYSEAVPALPGATETSSYVMNGTLATVSKSPLFSLIPPRASERPRTPPLPIPSLAFPQAHTPLSEKHLEDRNLQVYSRPPVSMPSSQVTTNAYFTTSAMKGHRANLIDSLTTASLASTEGQTGATVNSEAGQNARDTETHNPREARRFTPTTLSPASALSSSTEFSSATVASGGTVATAGVQTENHKSSLTTQHSLSPSPAPEETTPSPISRRRPPLEVLRAELLSPPLSVAAATDKAVFFSPLTAKEELIQHGRGQNVEVSPPFLTSSSLEGDYEDTARLFKYEQTQDSGFSTLSSNSTSFSSGSSGVPKAPAFFVTTLSSGVPSDGPVHKVLSQTAHLQSLPLETSETTLNLHTQVLLSLESLLDPSEMTAMGDLMVESTSAGELDAFYLHAVEEQATAVMDVTEAAENGSQAVVQQSDSNSSLLNRKMYHRRPTRSDDVFLDGFAIVSDDACGSGNYTSEMSLRRAPGQPPSHPDSFLALIVLQSNSSQPTLRVKSCCVTPTTRPTGPDVACCLFPRTPPECRYIQPHQNGRPHAASFTIQLFQMLNRSVAYLHCELSICLSNHPGCKQACSGNREPRFRPRGQSSYETLHNLISFGPVLKAQPGIPSEMAAESELAMMFPVLLGALVGFALLLGTSTFIWFHQRNKIKMAANLEGEGLCSP